MIEKKVLVLRLALSALAIGLLIPGCTSFRSSQDTGFAAAHPQPHERLQAGANAVYFQQGGRWHQLRISLKADELTPDDHGYRVDIRADASLWRYNPGTRAYDQPASFPGGDARHNLHFGFTDKERNTLRMFYSAGNEGGGGIMGSGRFGYVHTTFESPHQIVTKDDLPVTVRAVARYLPSGHREGAPVALAEVRQTWKARILPGGKMTFTAVD